MTPQARLSAAITVLDQILSGIPAEAALLRWSRASRFAGSGDRAAVRDLVFDSLRQMRSRAALGGSMTGRGLMIGLCRAEGRTIEDFFTGEGHAPAPLREDERPKPLSEMDKSDLPDWIYHQFQSDLGDKAPVVAAFLRQRAPVWLRVNAVRATPDQAVAALLTDGVEVEASPLCDHALCVTKGARRIAQGAAFAQGLVELQDLSSQLAVAAVPVDAGARVLDLCAGGGGKTLALAARQPAAHYFAHDIDPARMNDLPVRAKRAGVKVNRLETKALLQAAPFDLVLVDAPCSGSGTWRRTPEAKWRLTPDRLAEMCQIQRDLLTQACDLVADRGRIVYMTCSLFSAENQDQVQWFVKNTGFSVGDSLCFLDPKGSDGFFMTSFHKNQPR